MSKKKKGPVKTVKAGFAIAKIYRTPTKGRESFTVTYYKGRERNREIFSDLKRAVAHAQSITNSLASGELDVLELRSDDRLAYIRARDAVKPYGLALDLSALEYAEANSNVSNQLLKLGRQKMQIDKKTFVPILPDGWKQNVLRHSFGSYRLAILQDPAKVAYEMGNTPRMVFRHYRELVTRQDGERWFAVLPAGSNVVPMPTATSSESIPGGLGASGRA